MYFNGMHVDVMEIEFYEIHCIPESSFHPHPSLRHFKIIMVSRTTKERAVVCKWPSIESLAFFFKDRLQVLPEFDEECTLTQYDAIRLLKRRIDSEQLCFYVEWSPDVWLHHQAMEHLNAAMSMITDEHMDEARSNHIQLDNFYAIDYNALPQQLKDDVVGFVRVVWVNAVVLVHDDLGVEVKIPSMKSVQSNMSESESIILPLFDRDFTISLDSARLILRQNLPLELCIQLTKRRDFWINEFEELKSNMLSGAGAVHDP